MAISKDPDELEEQAMGKKRTKAPRRGEPCLADHSPGQSCHMAKLQVCRAGFLLLPWDTQAKPHQGRGILISLQGKQ